jgi:hypothetical protein
MEMITYPGFSENLMHTGSSIGLTVLSNGVNNTILDIVAVFQNVAVNIDRRMNAITPRKLVSRDGEPCFVLVRQRALLKNFHSGIVHHSLRLQNSINEQATHR